MSDLALLCEPVARIVWGKPSFETARELRWGTRGSRVVDRAKGVWHDHEHNVGGGALDLVPGATKPEQLQWLRDRGLISDAPSVASKNGNRSGAPPIIVATYDYTDESGASLFQVVRFDPKYFRQRRRDGNGGWSWSLSNARRVLYRLPELKDAVMSCRWVLIVEGEKDVDNLRKLGFAATCNPGGANKWRAEYSESLRGADVVIIGDNDDSGRLHAARVASSLQGIALRVRVLDLAKAWPACPPKGDISDWIEAGGTAEALAALIEALPDWAPTEDEKRRREQQARNGANGHDETEIVQLEIRRLAKLPLVEYDRERVSAAQGLGVRTSVLDRLVDAERKKSGDNNKQGQALMLPEPERWPERVEGEALLSELSLAIRRHVVLPKHSADAAALWAVHTYALEAVSITPRLAITSPEKQCGKTTLLDVIRCLTSRNGKRYGPVRISSGRACSPVPARRRS